MSFLSLSCSPKEESEFNHNEWIVEEYQRKQLLERVNREAATVGVEIPTAIEIQGEEIDLQTFVFEIKRRDTIPSGERDRVERAKRNLRRERIARIEQIEDNRVDYQTGQSLADSIIGIDRALNALENLRPVDIELEAEQKETADRKRWMNFLQQALGKKDGGSNRRGRL